MDEPTAEQRRILDQIAGQAGELAGALRAQFAGCRTRAEDYCAECFVLEAAPGAPALPPDAECPLGFEARIQGDTGPDASLLLWHEDGVVDSVEVSWYGDRHPLLAELEVLPRGREGA